MIRGLLLLLAFAGSPARLSAQEDSTQAVTPAAPDRWKMALDLAFTGTRGNSNVSMLTSEARITHLATELYELEASGQLRYGRSQGEEIARSTRVGLKFDLHPEAGWSPFVFLTAEREPFRRLEMRAYGGGGAKYTVWESDRGSLSLSSAAVYSMEEIVPEAGTVAPPTMREARTSWRVKGSRSFSETSRIENTTFYQPIWDRPGDYLIDAQTAISVQLSQALALRITHSFERDSTPPAGVQRDDQVVAMGISIEV